jgi:uncharacterized protein (DUF1684 family)
MAAAALSQTSPESPQAYRARIQEWRKSQEADLKKEGGWLTVSGLFWLAEGDNAMGASTACPVRLPASAPAHAGVFTLKDGHVSVQVDDGVKVTENDKPVTHQDLKADTSGAPDKLILGDLTLTVIQRGKRIGIRMYDRNSKALHEFKGCSWYPIDPAYVVTATFTAYDQPKPTPITNILGDTQDVPMPGYVTFTLNGKKCRLEAQAQGDGLFINFRDLTSSKTTYPAGRFLDVPKPENGHVVIDFNQAVNPPCAFTAHATCPLPPRGNMLPVEVLAGEKTHHPVD